MKLSQKSKYFLSSTLLIALSFLYVLLIKIGIDKQNIDLEKVNRISGVVEHSGIDIHYGSKGRTSDVFYIKLKYLDEKVGVYRFSGKYEDLLQLVKAGDSITVYVSGKANRRENVNSNVIQIEKGTEVLLSKTEYENKESTLVYIGIGGLISHAIIFYYNRKKNLRLRKK
ncbi:MULTISPECIES: hypothetical protein [unclassified Flavobacterium]|uniref:hypothetical protein n=1 Tax=unclassified Flavobacterium TaxID=196869 RepID=UPI001F148D03|nr:MULTISPECIES: hypothetical protein [unclassified Flavobacterium]UMY64661.1 hypothetical protein MKO97_09065 [Flavobacterium sp. HJ-32-4]